MTHRGLGIREQGSETKDQGSGSSPANSASHTPHASYAAAGVDIEAGQEAVARMTAAVRATYGPAVLSDVGHFGGLYDGAALRTMAAPVLVASTDGVGTKTKVAAALDRWDTIGQDLVNHCINDILVQGARPLFFLDYVATAHLQPEQIAVVVGGVAAASRAAGCALLGGETAEMPGVYEPGEIDLAGTIIGVVERGALLDGTAIRPGDAIVGLAASGLHTNGYSLARAVLAGLDWREPLLELGGSLDAALLTVHRSYLAPIGQLQAAGVTSHGLAQITGGGIPGNLPRIMPPGLVAMLQRGSWLIPPIFDLIQRQGAIADAEMFRVFNMGLGMLVVLPEEQVALAQQALPGEGWRVGTIMPSAEAGVPDGTVGWQS